MRGLFFMRTDDQFYEEDATGLVRVFGIGSGEASFYLSNAKFNTYAHSIGKYHCTKVFIEVDTPENIVDMTKIDDSALIKDLAINFGDKECKLFYSNKTNKLFKQLKNFEFRGIFPRNFPSFKLMSTLDKLTVEYTLEHCDWTEHEGIIDLIVHHYKANDLRPLAKMKSLRRLCLVQSSLKTLDGIEDIPNLETVYVVQAKNLTDLSALLKAKKVRNVLFESYSKVTNWDFLVGMPQLEHLNLHEVDNIEFISRLPNLVFFYAQKLGGKSFPSKILDPLQSELEEKMPLDQRGKNLPFFAPLTR
jgi:hypothetical protein